MGFREGRRGLRTGPEVRGATRTTDDWLTCRQVQHRALSGETIDILVLPGEDSAELLGWHDKWFTAFRPAGPAEHFMVQTALRSLVHLRRCRVALAAQETLLIEKTREGWRDGQRQVVLAPPGGASRDPDAAVAGLRETALGCLWLIGCGSVRPRVQDARPRDLAELFGLGTCFDAYQERVLEHFATSGSMGPGVDPLSAMRLQRVARPAPRCGAMGAPPAAPPLRAADRGEPNRGRGGDRRSVGDRREATQCASPAPGTPEVFRDGLPLSDRASPWPPAGRPLRPSSGAELGKPARRRRR